MVYSLFKLIVGDYFIGKLKFSIVKEKAFEILIRSDVLEDSIFSMLESFY
jgi:hypothetical protein